MHKFTTTTLVGVVLLCGHIVHAAPTSVGVFDDSKISALRKSDAATTSRAVAQVAQTKKLAAIFSGRSAWSAPDTKVVDVTNDVILKFRALGGKTASLPTSTKALPITPKGLSATQRDAASKAIRALRRLVSAYDAGISYVDFKPRLVDARVDIDEQLRLIPDGKLHDEIELSLEGYEAAMTAFNKVVTLEYYSVLKTTVLPQLLKKYSIPINFDNDGGDEFKKQNSVNEIIDPMIAAGKKHLVNAENLL